MKLQKTLLLLLVALCVSVAPSFGQGAAKKAAAAKADAAPAGLIDINSADAAALKSIPGVGDAYAAKIIANRPYKGKDEIVKKAGVPQGVYDKIKDKIIAKQK
jgi:competence protein ComEA